MTETRPTGNQITFNSATTGIHVLDEYLERAEAGGRTLGEMMEDLFLLSGELRPFEFQVVSNQLQYRPPGGNWTTIANYTTFYTSLTTAQTTAQTAATDAQTAATNAQTAYTNTATAYGNAVIARAGAVTARTDAETAAVTATTRASQADTYATNAQTSATTATTARDTASGHATTAATAKTAAETARDAAAGSATSASTSAGTATTKASEASTSASQALASKNAAATSETNAAGSASAAATSAASISGGPVTSVNSKTGIVSLTAADLGASTFIKQQCNYTTIADLGVVTVTTQTLTGRPTSFVLTGTTASGSTSITGMSSIAGIRVGNAISGTGIPGGTTVTGGSASTLTISAAATASGTVNLTFTNPSWNSLALDGGAAGVVVGSRILVRSQSASAENGIYEVTQAQSASNPFILTRASDANTGEALTHALTLVRSGTPLVASGWFMNASATTTIGVSPNNWRHITNTLMNAISALGDNAIANGVIARTSNSTADTLAYGTANTAATLMQRDGSGAISPILTDYRLTAVNLAAGAINLTNGNYFYKTLTGGQAFSFTTSATTGTQAAGFILELTNGGAYTVTWPASVKWPGGTAPTLTASGVDVLAFITDDAGTTWRGVMSQKDSR